MKENYQITLIRSFIFILVVGGAGLIFYSANINEIPEGALYNVGIELHAKDLDGNILNPLYVNSFVFYYDFSSQEGNLSFRVTEDLSFEMIRLKLPSLINNETVKIYVLRKGLPVYNMTNGEDYSYHSLGKFPDYLNNNESILSIVPLFHFRDDDMLIIKFEFTTEIIPKGRFIFINEGGTNVVLYEGDKGIGNINLKLGKDYQCISPCLYGLDGVEETFRSFEGDFKMKLDNRSKPEHFFYMNTFSKGKKFLKDLLLSIGASLLISGLVLLIGRLEQRDSNNQTEFNKFLQGKVRIKRIGKETLKKINDYFK